MTRHHRRRHQVAVFASRLDAAVFVIHGTSQVHKAVYTALLRRAG